jgi:hypothetical protein
MVSQRGGQEIRRQWARDNAEMRGPSRAKSVAAKLYPHLTDTSTRQRIDSDWQAQRQRPSRRFKRRPFPKRGAKEE